MCGLQLIRGARLVLTLALGFTPACTIIIEPPESLPVRPFFVPFSCLPVALNPVTGETVIENETEDVITAQLLFAVRVDRTTTNLASTFDALMSETVIGVAALGVKVTEAVLLPLDERPVDPILAAWGCGLDDPEALPPETVLRFHALARAPPSGPVGCAVDPLLALGADLPRVATNYPPGLDGTSGRTLFGAAPSLVIVVHVDALARRSGRGQSSCEGALAFGRSEGSDAAWLSYVGPGVPLPRVFHWFLATEEGIDDDEMAARCRAVEGFDLGLLDGLEASPLALYGPLAAEIRAGGGRASTLPLCLALVERDRQAFLLDELGGMAAELGLRFDPQLLLQLLESEGQFPEAETPMDGGGG